MNIDFICKINKNYVMINTLKIKLKSGSILTLDRDKTEYSYRTDDIDSSNNIILDMGWNDVYLWGIDDYHIFGDDGCHDIDYQEISDIMEYAEEIYFELEDDVPDKDYFVEIMSFNVVK